MLTQNASTSERHGTAPARLKRPRIADLLTNRWLQAGIWLAAIASWGLQIKPALDRPPGGDLDVIRNAVVAFLHNQPVYLQGHNPAMVFLYPPSALLLLTPLGLISQGTARATVAVLQIVAICVGGWLSLEVAGRRARFALPLVVLGLSLYTPARISVLIGNVDGFVLAGEAAFLLAAARGRWLLAALAIGITLAVKPALVPLLILFLLRRRLVELVVAVSVPAALCVLALAVMRDPLTFMTQVAPFILQGQATTLQPYSMSLYYAATALGLSPPVALALRALALVIAGVVLVICWRRPVPEGVRLAEAAGILMLTTLLTFSYSWNHYGLFLVPMLVLVGAPMTVVRGVGAVAALYLIGSPVEPVTAVLWPTLCQHKMTLGYLVLLGTIAVVAVRSRSAPPGEPVLEPSAPRSRPQLAESPRWMGLLRIPRTGPAAEPPGPPGPASGPEDDRSRG